MAGEDVIDVMHPNVLAFTLFPTRFSGGRHAQHWTARISTVVSETTCNDFLFAPHVVFQPMHKFCRSDILLDDTFSLLVFMANI